MAGIPITLLNPIASGQATDLVGIARGSSNFKATFPQVVVGGLPAQASQSGKFLTTDGSSLSWGLVPWSAVTQGNQSANLVLAGPASGAAAPSAFRALVAADTPACVILAGSAGGQTVYGGTNASDSLTFHSTSHATKGYLVLGSGSLVGVNKATPAAQLHVAAASASTKTLLLQAAASPTVNLLELQDSGTNVKLSVTKEFALLAAAAVPATGNYGLLSAGGPWDGSAGGFVGSSSGTLCALNAASGFAGNLLDVQLAGVRRLLLDPNGAFTLTPPAVSGVAANAGYVDALFDFTHTVTFAGSQNGTNPLCGLRVRAPTYAGSGAVSLTDVSTVRISGAPVAGTNATFTGVANALYVVSGQSRFGGTVTITDNFGLSVTNATSTLIAPNANALSCQNTSSGGTSVATFKNTAGSSTSIFLDGSGQAATTDSFFLGTWQNLGCMVRNSTLNGFVAQFSGRSGNYALLLTPLSASCVGLAVQAAASQSSDLLRVLKSDGTTVLFRVGPSGTYHGTQGTLAYAATISMDSTLGRSFTLSMTGDATLNAATGGTADQRVTLVVANDATPRTLTFGTNFKAAGNLVGTANKTATVTFVSNGTNWYETARTTGL